MFTTAGSTLCATTTTGVRRDALTVAGIVGAGVVVLCATGCDSLGRQLMLMWRLTAIEPVPADYEQTLADIAKAFPPPVAGK